MTTVPTCSTARRACRSSSGSDDEAPVVEQIDTLRDELSRRRRVNRELVTVEWFTAGLRHASGREDRREVVIVQRPDSDHP